jgi:hypothetical protein
LTFYENEELENIFGIVVTNTGGTIGKWKLNECKCNFRGNEWPSDVDGFSIVEIIDIKQRKLSYNNIINVRKVSVIQRVKMS